MAAVVVAPSMLTVTGRILNPLQIRPSDVCLEDVAHHLAHINRFNGAAIKAISVAQHAYYVSMLLEGTGYEYQGLHHDDGEAYLGDMNKWLKGHPTMGTFKDAEAIAQVACYEHFKVEWPDTGKLMSREVEAADRFMLRYEGPLAFGAGVWQHYRNRCLPIELYPDITTEEMARVGYYQFLPPSYAKQLFIERHKLLLERGFGK